MIFNGRRLRDRNVVVRIALPVFSFPFCVLFSLSSSSGCHQVVYTLKVDYCGSRSVVYVTNKDSPINVKRVEVLLNVLSGGERLPWVRTWVNSRGTSRRARLWGRTMRTTFG